MRKSGLILTIILLSFTCSNRLLSQSKDSAKLHVSGYADAYYALYNDSVGLGNFQKFPTTSSISNNFGLNIAQLGLKYDGKNVRGHIVLHYGDLPRSAWASDFNMIQRAHVGVRVAKNAWIDAGFFRTHFGTEGFLPKENICSSIATTTFYEPYFQSGVRLEFAAGSKWMIDFYILNGYNMFTDNNKKKSVGFLVSYTPKESFNINYSNYLGDDTPDGVTTSHFRIHQNAYFNYIKNKVTVQVGADLCLQENSKLADPKKWASMFSGLASLKYKVANKVAIYTRGEFLNDPDGFMTTIITDKTGKLTGYKIFGVTAGLEVTPTDNSYIRLEGRQLMMNSDQEIFRRDGINKSSRGEVMLNMGVWFGN